MSKDTQDIAVDDRGGDEVRIMIAVPHPHDALARSVLDVLATAWFAASGEFR